MTSQNASTDDSTPTFSWKSTIHAALASCTSSSTSSTTYLGYCLPCLRRASSSDSLFANQGQRGRIQLSDEGGDHPVDGIGYRGHPDFDHRIPRARPDELEGLLASASSSTFSSSSPLDGQHNHHFHSDSDDDAERLSLHSNFGRSKRKRKASGKGKGKKAISLFGFDPFGVARRRVPRGGAKIFLDDDEATDALYADIDGTTTTTTTIRNAAGIDTDCAEAPHPEADPATVRVDADDHSTGLPVVSSSTTAAVVRSNANLETKTKTKTNTLSTSFGHLDIDAAPLSPSVIQGLASEESVAALVVAAETFRSQDEQAKAEKEQRRRLRKERKQAEREAATAAAAAFHDNIVGGVEERFEGFQGSGIGVEVSLEGGGDEFEGFQGSGGAVAFNPLGPRTSASSSTSGSGSRPRSKSKSNSTSASGSGSGSGRFQDEPFGVFVSSPGNFVSPPLGRTLPNEEDEFVQVSKKEAVILEEEARAAVEDDEADLDGGMYTGKRRGVYRPGGGSQGSGSKSGTSYSQAQLYVLGGSYRDPLQAMQHPHIERTTKSTSRNRISGGSSGRSHSSSTSSSNRAGVGHGMATRTQQNSLSTEMGHGASESTATSRSTPTSTPVTTPMTAEFVLSTKEETRRRTKKNSRDLKVKGDKPSRSSSSGSQPHSAFGSGGSLLDAGELGVFVSPSTVEQGLGFFDVEDLAAHPLSTPRTLLSDTPPLSPPPSATTATPTINANTATVNNNGRMRGFSLAAGGSSGFPSVGFGGAKAGSASARADVGAFLARRGGGGSGDDQVSG